MKKLERKFYLPALLALLTVTYPISYIFRISDEAWQMSAIGNIPAGIWVLSAPVAFLLSLHAYKKVTALMGANQFVPYEKPLDSRCYFGINRTLSKVTVSPRVYYWMKHRT